MDSTDVDVMAILDSFCRLLNQMETDNRSQPLSEKWLTWKYGNPLKESYPLNAMVAFNNLNLNV